MHQNSTLASFCLKKRPQTVYIMAVLFLWKDKPPYKRCSFFEWNTSLISVSEKSLQLRVVQLWNVKIARYRHFRGSTKPRSKFRAPSSRISRSAWGWSHKLKRSFWWSGMGWYLIWSRAGVSSIWYRTWTLILWPSWSKHVISLPLKLFPFLVKMSYPLSSKT